MSTDTNQASLMDYGEVPREMRLSEMHVEQIPLAVVRRFMAKYHYSGGIGNAAMPWGMYHNPTGQLVGAIAFMTPISENTRDLIFGDGVCGCQLVEPKECNRDGCEVWGDHHHLGEHVTELHRLAFVPKAPPNSGSWFISRALTRLKEYKPKYWAVVSMADSTEGHDGTQYQGANADYYGVSGARVEYVDEDGRKRSPRQCGENITLADAKQRGWEIAKRDPKHRYVFWLPYRSMRSVDGLREFAEIEIQPYPNTEEGIE